MPDMDASLSTVRLD
ncbi:hypothetical protein IEO21_10547 [Rhodonia placenta]|nr:hypothetical protein IEO21_10547 [Postia placenta]